MAYTKKRASGRGGYSRSRRSYSAPRRTSKRSRRYSAGGSKGRAVQHTVRIVLEHPTANPMMTVPVGQQVDTSVPKKARF